MSTPECIEEEEGGPLPCIGLAQACPEPWPHSPHQGHQFYLADGWEVAFPSKGSHSLNHGMGQGLTPTCLKTNAALFFIQ